MTEPQDFTPTLWERIKDYLSLQVENDEALLADSLHKSMEFKGANLWILLFACFFASVGLYSNSLAVIIGAMLISPLMGPIVGVGFAAGLNDLELLKQAIKNLGLMVAVSLVGSTLYFFIAPYVEPTAEILARTRPTLSDVLIAVLGGATGILATTQKDRTSAILGVAIATALMPPLCTAGYGLATGQIKILAGGFYLFFINSIFIALTTALCVRLFGFPQKQFLDPLQEKRVRIFIGGFVLVTIIPAVFSGIQAVREAVFMRRATNFIEENIKFTNTTILKPYGLRYGSDTSLIELVLIGEPLPDQVVQNIQQRLHAPEYSLHTTKLVLRQSNSVNSYFGNGSQNINGAMVESMFREKDKTIQQQGELIRTLEAQLARNGGNGGVPPKQLADIAKKLAIVFPDIRRIGYNDIVRVDAQTGVSEVIPTVLVDLENGVLSDETRQKIAGYLRIELRVENIEVIGY